MNTSIYLDNKVLEKSILDYKTLKKEKKSYELIIEDLEESFQYNNSKKDIYNNKIKEYNLICSNLDVIHKNLANEFTTLAEHIIKYKKFNFVEFDDAMQEFVMICFDKMERFDPNYIGKSGKKAKAFNYMTTCILNHYRQLYRSARNYNELKKKFQASLQQNDKFSKGKIKKNLNNIREDNYYEEK